MRKLYALLGGLFLIFTAVPTIAQNETANFTFSVNAGTVHFTNTSTTPVNDTALRRCLWQFGDGSAALTHYSTSPDHSYLQPGTYQVCLKLFRRIFPTTGGDTLALVATTCKPVVISEPDNCTANFESPAVSPSLLGKYFIAQPWHNHNKKPVSICWSFGDGRDTCIQYAATFTGAYGVYHVYNQPGNYTVCVNILYDGGCQSQTCHIVPVNIPDSCKADFERLPVVSSTSLQAGFQALPWHNNNKRPVRICWTFGDGRDTCIQYANTNPGPYIVNHIYVNAGLYEVCVNILYQGGCEAKKCELTRIGHPDSCRADFERLPVTSTNDPLAVVYKALPWNNNNKKPARICWTFGDGRDTCINYLNIYNGQYNVNHTYYHAGNYEVCIKITYYGGCEAWKCKTIPVGRPDSCGANFERIPVTAGTILTAGFRALPRHNNNRKPARICWTFGDGRDTCINYAENYTGSYVVTHQYGQRGLFEVCVRILYYGGCEARTCERVQIGEKDSCSASFERFILSDGGPLTIGLKALPWNNNNRKPARVCWSFGDGKDTCINYAENYTGLYIVKHRYDHPGQYEVCVKILYFGGCEAGNCKPVVIPPLPGNCAVQLFEITPSVTSLVRGFFASPSSATNRRPERICWYFGDGTDTCIMLNPQNPVLLPDLFIRHIYPGPGVFRACVKILFQEGCIAENCREVVIRNPSNSCGGYMTDSLIAPRTFRFKGFGIQNPNDEVISYRWAFGDGSNATGREVTHMYNQGGDYEVCLTIRTRLGCETKICRTVRVPGNNQPALHLTPNPVINELHAEFFSTHTEQVSIRILNSTGVPVRSYVRNVTTGPNNWNFDLSALLPGIYSFVVQSPNQLASAIFIKQ